MRTALAVEWLKARRSPMVLFTSVSQVALPPVFAVLIVATSAQNSDLGLGAKASGLGVAPGWEGYLSALGQVSAGWTVITSGLLAAWLFGQEFVQSTVGSLFATAVPRSRVAAAKVVVLLCWGLGCASLGIPVAALVGLVYRTPTADQVAQLGVIAVVVVLTVLLAPIAALVATLTRSYLPAVGVLIGVTVLAQVVAGLGIGSWFPWTIPTLWALPRILAESPHTNATALVPAWHLSVVAFTGAVMALAVVSAWRRLRLA